MSDDTLPYVKTSETSQAAAEDARPRARGSAFRIFEYIRSCGEEGATRDEIVIHMDGRLGPPPSITARVRALCYSGLVTPIGRRPTRTGSQADVLRAVEGADFDALYTEPPVGAGATRSDDALLTVCREAASGLRGSPIERYGALQRVEAAILQYVPDTSPPEASEPSPPPSSAILEAFSELLGGI